MGDGVIIFTKGVELTRRLSSSHPDMRVLDGPNSEGRKALTDEAQYTLQGKCATRCSPGLVWWTVP